MLRPLLCIVGLGSGVLLIGAQYSSGSQTSQIPIMVEQTTAVVPPVLQPDPTIADPTPIPVVAVPVIPVSAIAPPPIQVVVTPKEVCQGSRCGSHKSKVVVRPAKHRSDRRAVPVGTPGCQGAGCIIAGMVKEGRIRFSSNAGCDPALDYRISTGQQATPIWRNTYDAGMVRYYPVNAEVYQGLLMMAQEMQSIEVTCLETGHSYHPAGQANASDHSVGRAVDIGEVGQSVITSSMQLGPAGKLIDRLAAVCLQAGGSQAISLRGPEGSMVNYRGKFRLSNHTDHLHCGW